MFPMYVAVNRPPVGARATITGAHAGEMIAEAALAIEIGATAEDIAATIHPHPTLSETYQDTADMFGVGAVH